MPTLGFAHGGYMVPILGSLAHAGVDTEAALAIAGLPPDVSQYPSRPVPHFLGVQFIDQTARKVGDESFGLAVLSETNGLSAEMVPSWNAASEPGCLQVMRSLADIMNRTTTSVIQIVEQNDALWIELQWTHGEGRPPWSAELYVAGIMLVSLRNVLGADWQPSAMKMLSPRYPARERIGLPDCPIQWNAPTISVAIDRRDMAVRLAGSAPYPGDAPVKSIPDLSEASPELVCETIFGLLRQEDRSMSDVADCFGLTMRSFHRCLDRYGLHFRQIVENFRLERAMKILQDEDVSVTELSLELGYDHPQNFARAFRRHVGLSPRQYRNALSSSADLVDLGARG